MRSHMRAKGASLLALSAGLFMTACKKDISNEVVLPSENNSVVANAINSTWSVNWDNYAHGTTYTRANANTDFGNTSSWVDSRGYISNGNLRITVLKNALSGAGGVISNIDIADGTAYEVDYDVRFHSQFDFSKGGKIGFGFLIGDGNTGGDPGWDGNGGSARLMWYQTAAGRVFFQPYLYHRDQAGNYGDTYSKSYPASGSLQRGVNYHVHVYVKSNTGSNTDGAIQISINGTNVLDRAMRWTTNDSKRLIRYLSFHTFRGGSTADWQSTTDGYIYYDNLSVHKIS